MFCYRTNTFSGELFDVSEEGALTWMLVSELTNDNVAPTFLDMLPIFFEKKQELHYKDDLPEYY